MGVDEVAAGEQGIGGGAQVCGDRVPGVSAVAGALSDAVDALGGVQEGQPDPDNGQLLPGRDRRGHCCSRGVQAVADVSRYDGKQPVKLSGDFRVRGRGQTAAVLFGRGDALARDGQEVTERGRHRRKPEAGGSASPPLRHRGRPAGRGPSALAGVSGIS